jgi:AraC-like DNA-binding protein
VETKKKFHLSAELLVRALSESIGAIVQNDGDFSTKIQELSLHRRNTPTAPVHCIYGMGLGVVVQGTKQVVLGGKTTSYGGGQTLLTTIDLPVVSHVTQASTSEPFLGMMLTLDPSTVIQLATTFTSEQPIKRLAFNPLSVGILDAGLADALRRLVSLLDEPSLIPHVSPLIQQEIIIRLLAGSHGGQLRHIAAAGSPSQHISRVVAWLKLNFTRSVPVNELAASASMSPSTFRQHFRTATGISPLQFQKKLRLQEARQLMLNKHLDVGTAALNVGYESASQFSREYSREFGEPPQRDIKNLRSIGRT